MSADTFIADENDGNTLQFFHININCSDFDRSFAFYTAIGFKPVVDFGADSDPRSFGERGLGPVLNLPDDCTGRAMLLALGADPRATRLDLIEWKQPRSGPKPAPDMTRLGVARVCLKVRDCGSLYAKLLAGGYTIYSKPTRIVLAGVESDVFCCEDPDGTVMEFMQFIK